MCKGFWWDCDGDYGQGDDKGNGEGSDEDDDKAGDSDRLILCCLTGFMSFIS